MALSLEPIPDLPAKQGRLTLDDASVGPGYCGSFGEIYGHIASLRSAFTQGVAARWTSPHPKAK